MHAARAAAQVMELGAEINSERYFGGRIDVLLARARAQI